MVRDFDEEFMAVNMPGFAIGDNASTTSRICYDSIHMQDPVETSELLAFARTVDARSLSRAATLLGVPRATVSRRLARLEERLGARLLKRTTRSLALTDAGEALYRHARIVLDAVADAEASVRRSDGAVRGDLRVSVPPMTTASFYDFVLGFARQYPDVRLQLSFSTSLVDLRTGGYDVALRATTHIEPGLVARTLAKDRIVAVASPAYLEAHGTPRTAKDLRQHRCLLGFGAGDLPATYWPMPGGGKLHVEGVFASNEITLLAAAAAQGHGITVLPGSLVAPLVERGELVHILAGVIEAEARIAVVYLERELLPPQVRAFVDALAAWAPEGLVKHLPERCENAGVRRPRQLKASGRRRSR
jgi:DNA-binding transcriptional LysR family regulator